MKGNSRGMELPNSGNICHTAPCPCQGTHLCHVLCLGLITVFITQDLSNTEGCTELTPAAFGFRIRQNHKLVFYNSCRNLGPFQTHLITDFFWDPVLGHDDRSLSSSDPCMHIYSISAEEWLMKNGCSKGLQRSWENYEDLKDDPSRKTDRGSRQHSSPAGGRRVTCSTWVKIYLPGHPEG